LFARKKAQENFFFVLSVTLTGHSLNVTKLHSWQSRDPRDFTGAL